MSKNKQIIKNWRARLSNYYVTPPPCTCDCGEAGQYFYQYFQDDPRSYSPDLYSFSPGLEVRGGEVSGEGTVSRTNTWVFPSFSGWTSWEAAASSSQIRSKLSSRSSHRIS